jgi:RNA polymerase sigma factor (sigma-70 family)
MPINAEEYATAYSTGYYITMRLLLSRGVAAEEARELAQAAWVKGWEYREQLRRADVVGTWVNTIALNALRSQKRSEPRFDELQENTRSSTQDLAAIDAKTVLEICKQRDRDILENRYLQGMKVREIAQRTGSSEIAIRIRLLRAKRNLRKRLESRRSLANIQALFQRGAADEVPAVAPVAPARASNTAANPRYRGNLVA